MPWWQKLPNFKEVVTLTHTTFQVIILTQTMIFPQPFVPKLTKTLTTALLHHKTLLFNSDLTNDVLLITADYWLEDAAMCHSRVHSQMTYVLIQFGGLTNLLSVEYRTIQCSTKVYFQQRCLLCQESRWFQLIYLPTRARCNYWQNSGVACNTSGNPSVFSQNSPNWKTQYLTHKTHQAKNSDLTFPVLTQQDCDFEKLRVIKCLCCLARCKYQRKTVLLCVPHVFALIEEHTGWLFGRCTERHV